MPSRSSFSATRPSASPNLWSASWYVPACQSHLRCLPLPPCAAAERVDWHDRLQMQDYQPRMLSTYALTLFRHNAEIDGQTVAVDFWDTAGQERFNSMHPAYYHQAHACILCFDVTRKSTYKNLPQWLKELREYRAKIPTICIANKVDVDLKVMSKDFAFPKKHGCVRPPVDGAAQA